MTVATLTQCPVAPLARQLDALHSAYLALDDLRPVGDVESACQKIDTSIEQVERAATALRAESREGAILQLLLIGHDVRVVLDHDLMAVDIEATCQGMLAKLYSALDVLGCDFDGALAEAYMPLRLR